MDAYNWPMLFNGSSCDFLGRIQEAAKAFYINLLLFSIGHGVYWKFFKHLGERQVSGTNFLYTGDNSYTVQG